MKLEDVLTIKEMEEYHGNWKPLTAKDAPENEHTVHSGMPVIGTVFQYKSKPVFRTHVFQKRLRKFDPYFITLTYVHPFWHALHYFIAMEQTYHAASSLIRDNSRLVGKDVPEKFEWKRSVFWVDRISIELILEDLGQHGHYLKERGCFTFYDDRTNKAISQTSALAFWRPRAYVRSMENIKLGKEKPERLIRKIERQDINLRKLINQRQNLPTKDYLISELMKGNVPEQELHNFFSFWNKPE